MEDIFCKIVNGEIPSYKIYEDDVLIAFLDLDQSNAGHTLIVPKTHYTDLYDIDSVVLTHILSVAKTLSGKITNVLRASGVSLTQNNGDVQEVKHFHLHIIPHYVNNTSIDIETIFNKLKD